MCQKHWWIGLVIRPEMTVSGMNGPLAACPKPSEALVRAPGHHRCYTLWDTEGQLESGEFRVVLAGRLSRIRSMG